MAFSVFITFAIQYTFFPGVIYSTPLSFLGNTNANFPWFIIFVSTFHSVLDTLGRFLSGKFNIVPKKHFVWACLSRIIFVVLYTVQYIQSKNKDDKTSILHSDAFILLNFFFFSITCGYLSNHGMTYGSDASTVN